MSQQNSEIVNRFFAAMQGGAESGDALLALFAPDAVYIEPFSGKPSEHRGIAAVKAAMELGWKHPLPDMTIQTERVQMDGNEVRVRWICRSPGLPGGQGHGENHFTLHDGLISRLETTIV